jgi:hypothetical protein
MTIEKRVIIHIFPYLVLGSGHTQSTITILKDYSKADTGGVELHECFDSVSQ